MRATDPREQERVDAALNSLYHHLEDTGTHPATRADIIGAAHRALLLHDHEHPLGWIVAWWADTNLPAPLGVPRCVHVEHDTDIPSVLALSNGRLAYVLELAPWWEQTGNTYERLVASAARIPKALGADEAEQRKNRRCP